jgi:hypothetical protein
MEMSSTINYLTPPQISSKFPRPTNNEITATHFNTSMMLLLCLPETGFPNACERVDGITNRFPITFQNLPEQLFHYDVDIIPLFEGNQKAKTGAVQGNNESSRSNSSKNLERIR